MTSRAIAKSGRKHTKTQTDRLTERLECHYKHTALRVTSTWTVMRVATHCNASCMSVLLTATTLTARAPPEKFVYQRIPCDCSDLTAGARVVQTFKSHDRVTECNARVLNPVWSPAASHCPLRILKVVDSQPKL